MTAIIKQRRILLKEWFVAEDARQEEAVTQVGGVYTRPLPINHTHGKQSHATPTTRGKHTHPSLKSHTKGQHPEEPTTEVENN